MVPKARATAEQAAKLADMSKRYPKTGRAYRIVAGLDDFYACRSMDDAERSFDSLYSWMRRCRLQPMKDAAETLKRHRDKILAYFKNRLTNAICVASTPWFRPPNVRPEATIPSRATLP